MALENCNVSQVQIEGTEGETQLSGYVDLLIQPLNGTTVSAEELFVGEGVNQGGNTFVGGNVTNGVTQVQFIDNIDGTVIARVSYDTFIFGQLNNVNELRVDIDRRRKKDPPPPPDPVDDPPPPPPPPPQEEVIHAKIWDVFVVDENHEDIIDVEDVYSSYNPEIFDDGFVINRNITTDYPQYNQVSTIPGLAEQLEQVNAENDYMITKRHHVNKVPYNGYSWKDSQRRNRFLERTVKISEQGLAEKRYFEDAFAVGVPFLNNPYITSPSPVYYGDEYSQFPIWEISKLYPPYNIGTNNMQKFANVNYAVVNEQSKVFDNRGNLIEFKVEYFFISPRLGQQVSQYFTNVGQFYNSYALAQINGEEFNINEQIYSTLSGALEEVQQAFLNGTYNHDHNNNEPVIFPNWFETNFHQVPLTIPDDYVLHPFPDNLQNPTVNMGGGLLCLLAYKLNRRQTKSPVPHGDVALGFNDMLVNNAPKRVRDAKWRFNKAHYLGGSNDIVIKSDLRSEFEVEVVENNTKSYYNFEEKLFKNERSSTIVESTAAVTELEIIIPSRSKTTETCATAAGQTSLTLATANDNIKAGMRVAGAGIPNNTVIKKERYVDGRFSTNVVEMSKAATATSGAVALEFESEDTYTFNIRPLANNASNTTVEDTAISDTFGISNLVSVGIKFTSTNSAYTLPASTTLLTAMPGAEYKKFSSQYVNSDFSLLTSIANNYKTYTIEAVVAGKTATSLGTATANVNKLQSEDYIQLRDNPISSDHKKNYNVDFTNRIKSATYDAGNTKVIVTGEIIIHKMPNKSTDLLIDLDNLFTLS